MISPYRISAKVKGDDNMKYIYAVWNTIRSAISSFWDWMSWENFIFLFTSCVCIILVSVGLYTLYGHMFLKHTDNGCYIQSSYNTVEVKKDIDWEQDPSLFVCLKNDVECLDKVMNSSVCN